MASRRNHLFLWAAVLLAVLAGAATAARSPPSSCAAGQAIPRRPLPGCRWYAASRTCSAVPKLPREAMKEIDVLPAAGGHPGGVPVQGAAGHDGGDGPAGGGGPQGPRLLALAPAVVTEAECGLTTIHGRPLCDALSAES
ncbi:unnamed protein product [Urochloa decumbens]|uniref:Uncharacterized protein n=1 Tax=Urochloa decumbens TaxID=240449 RepID=A0ABC8WNT7_9POAL